MIAHWDEVEKVRREYGHLRGLWTYLGEAAGTRNVGVRRIEVEPGEVPTPAHVHSEDEEIFFVLGGSGLSWQDGETFEILAGDTLVHAPLGKAHTLRAGEEGLDVLAFGPRPKIGGLYLPNSGTYSLSPTWVEVGSGEHPFVREPELEWPPPSPRPSSIVNVDEAESEDWTLGSDMAATSKFLGASAGSVRAGLNLDIVPPGSLNTAPHCHSAEEEIFVVLEGEGTLLLGDEEHPVRRGHVVARPPGTKVAHAFRGADAGLTVLLYGTREPNAMTYYPRSGVVALRGIGVLGRIERVDGDDVF